MQVTFETEVIGGRKWLAIVTVGVGAMAFMDLVEAVLRRLHTE